MSSPAAVSVDRARTRFQEPRLSIARQAERLMELAKAPAERERLLLAIAELCESAEAVGALDTAVVQTLLNDIFMCLVVEAEREIRRRLSEKLAHAHWAPRALINVLALDEIEIARPVIASSPMLQDRDLIRLLVEATIEHQIEVARRPRLGALVVDAILTQEEPAVLTALASNETADISPLGMERLVEASRRIVSLRTPLSRHPRLTESLAQRMYAWVGEALRATLSTRFQVDGEALDQAIAEAVKETREGAPEGPAETPEGAAEREEMERRLVSKLHEAGQLRPGYLLRALKEGKLSLFEAALARLGEFTPEHVRAAICSDRPELLAMACSAVGLDRSVFATVLKQVRELNSGAPRGPEEAAQRALGAFGPHPGTAAGAAFRHAVTTV